MPHRRPQKKGSFVGHFDDLLKQFDRDSEKDPGARDEPSEDKRKDHGRLFERAWRNDGNAARNDK